jgi:hypothetical protein
MIMNSDSSAGVRAVKRVLLAATATIGPVALGVLMGPRLAAQVVPPSAGAPVFEAASVRPAADKGRQGGRGTPEVVWPVVNQSARPDVITCVPGNSDA